MLLFFKEKNVGCIRTQKIKKKNLSSLSTYILKFNMVPNIKGPEVQSLHQSKSTLCQSGSPTDAPSCIPLPVPQEIAVGL